MRILSRLAAGQTVSLYGTSKESSHKYEKELECPSSKGYYYSWPGHHIHFYIHFRTHFRASHLFSSFTLSDFFRLDSARSQMESSAFLHIGVAEVRDVYSSPV